MQSRVLCRSIPGSWVLRRLAVPEPTPRATISMCEGGEEVASLRRDPKADA